MNDIIVNYQKRNIMKYCLLIAFLITVSGCSTTAKDSQRFDMFDNFIVEKKLKSINKIRSFQFRNWKSLDDEHLIVSSSFKNQYLITLNGFCHNLNIAQQIGLKQSMQNSLSAKFDSIVVKNNFNQECQIKTIHEINKNQEDELVKLRKSYYKNHE